MDHIMYYIEKDLKPFEYQHGCLDSNLCGFNTLIKPQLAYISTTMVEASLARRPQGSGATQ